MSKPRTFTCPHCGESVICDVEITARKGLKGNGLSPDQKAEQWRETLSPYERTVLDAVKGSGLLECFEAALKASSHSGLPSNLEKYFLSSWLSLARPRRIPHWALQQFRGLYPGANIMYYSANFVGCVVADGKMSLFLPTILIGGVNTLAGAVEADATGIERWVKTKLGYVPESARLMIQATQVRSMGELAIPDIGGKR